MHLAKPLWLFHLGFASQPVFLVDCCYRPQRSWAKVMFLHVSVILFIGGGLGRPPPGADAPLGADPPEQCMLEDTANERAVRILLECNLVHKCRLILGRNSSWSLKRRSVWVFSPRQHIVQTLGVHSSSVFMGKKQLCVEYKWVISILLAWK